MDEEKDLGVITNSLSVSMQCAEAAKKEMKIPGLVRRQFKNMDRECFTLLYKTFIRPHLEYAIQFWSPYMKRDIECLEKVQRRATKLVSRLNKKLIRRWDSERELSLRRHRARTTKYNRLVHKFRHRSTRLCVGTYVFTTKFSEITQYNGHYVVQGHSRSPILVPIESSYDFLLVINTNLPPILHRFRDIALERSKIADYSSNFR